MSVDTLLQNLKQRVDSFESDFDAEEIGRIVEVADGIVRIAGLESCQASERLIFPPTADGKEVSGLALNLEEGMVGAVIFGDFEHIAEGDVVRRSGEVLSVPVSNRMTGRVLNPLLAPIDGK